MREDTSIITIGNPQTWLMSLPDEKMPCLVKGLIVEIIHQVGLRHPAIRELFEQIDSHWDHVSELFSLLHAYAGTHYGFTKTDVTTLGEFFTELGKGNLLTVGITYVRAVENCILLSKIEADVDPPPRRLKQEKRKIANELSYVLLELLRTGFALDAVTVPAVSRRRRVRAVETLAAASADKSRQPMPVG